MTLLTRRSLLAASATLALPRALFAQGQVFDTDVIIIGAGAAGLAAAKELRARKRSFVVLEARERIGGRCFTDTSLGEPYDAGALYIHWSETNPWTQIAADLGVKTQSDSGGAGPFQLYEKGVRVPEAERGKRRAVFERLSTLLDEDTANVPDISFTERMTPEGEAVVAAGGTTARMALGEEPERVSARDYARLWSGDDLVVPSGYGALVARYGADVPVRLGARVEAVDWSGAGVVVTTQSGALRARAAIVTASAGVLAAGGIKFNPELPVATREGINGLEMGALTKIALKFNGARFGIPSGADVFETDDAKSTFDFECWPFNRDLVVTYIGGDHARGLSALGEAGAIEVALDRFALIAGGDARKAFVAGRLNAWSEDPLSLGSYSHARPGQADARAKLAQPVAEKLFFAGEATGGADFGGAMTAGGAWLAGRDAARA